MRFLNKYFNDYDYRHLPAFSSFVLNNHLDTLVREQIKISYEIDLPLLKKLKEISSEQLFEFNKAAAAEFLRCLAENKAQVQIELSLKKWEADQLGIIGKFGFLAEDITLFNYTRAKSLRKLIPLYSQDLTFILELIDEIDIFFVDATTAGANTFVKILKDQITKNERELLDAQQIAHIGSFEWDITTNQTNNSPEIYRIYEIEPDTGPDKFMEYIHPDDKQKVYDHLAKAMTDGSYEYEYRFRKDGKTKHIFSKGVVIYEQDKPKKIVGTVQDITNRKHIEQELLEKTIALERSNESLQQFAHIASHDLKEPLRKISLLTDQVIRSEKSISDKSHVILTKAHDSSRRMLQMIDDIMDYSAVTHWEESTLADLGDIVKEAIDFLEQTITEKNATIIYHDLPEVTVIRSQIRQLMQNLLANALKFSKPDVSPEISIVYKWLKAEDVQNENITGAGKYLQVSVQDNGIGFDQHFSKQIFNLFSRLHSKNTYNGSGLGLAIAKRIIDHHEGVIEASSGHGGGAKFTFIIPQ